MEGWGWPEYPREDPRSLEVEALAQLEILNHQLIVRDDIPAFVRFLSTPSGEEDLAWKEWEHYWESVDYAARREQLANDDYYVT